MDTYKWVSYFPVCLENWVGILLPCMFKNWIPINGYLTSLYFWKWVLYKWVTYFPCIFKIWVGILLLCMFKNGIPVNGYLTSLYLKIGYLWVGNLKMGNDLKVIILIIKSYLDVLMNSSSFFFFCSSSGGLDKTTDLL